MDLPGGMLTDGVVSVRPVGPGDQALFALGGGQPRSGEGAKDTGSDCGQVRERDDDALRDVLGPGEGRGDDALVS
ncbi:hypothetical protein DEH69_06355 [Streptomyces sp. PT12]|nr:hypothetical protein DEH69_06355 [Streptomyces sp. PT12]